MDLLDATNEAVEPTAGAAMATADEAGPAPPMPASAVAVALFEAVQGETALDLIHIAADERRAEEIGAILRSLSPETAAEIHVFPPWDCLPYDRASPSRLSMGRRMSVLARLAAGRSRPCIVVTSPEAAIQKVPPSEALKGWEYTVTVGDPADLAGLDAFARRTGYRTTERVDEPGDIDLRGQVVDVFPPAAQTPFRLDLEDGRIARIRSFDPVDQRTLDTLPGFSLGPASEVLLDEPEGAPSDPSTRPAGMEHWLADHYARLETLFDYLPGARLSSSSRADDRRLIATAQLQDAYQSRLTLAGHGGRSAAPPAIKRLYLDDVAWAELTDAAPRLDLGAQGLRPVPDFALGARPYKALAEFIGGELAAKRRVVLAGAARDTRAIVRRLTQYGEVSLTAVKDWSAVQRSAPGALLELEVELDEGFIDAEAGVSMVAAAQVLGSRAHAPAAPRSAVAALMGEPDLRFGDTVIHEAHGVGVLKGLETVQVGGADREAARLEYHGGATLLVPTEDFGKLWRYGSEEQAVHLDRLNTEAWGKRRAEIGAAVIATAEHLVALARTRDAAAAPKLIPPRLAYERVVAGFAYPETADQGAAIQAVLQDLASGRPMDRLVCGDVGFGKTEVAIRAIAAAVLSGKQAALVAPTTVLVRQHVQTLRRRFAQLGLEVAHLSRLVEPKETKRVKQGLANGDIRIVVGTHALAAQDIAFAGLGLLAVDEEQRFGAKLKLKLRDLAPHGHLLTLTATPIPRTLQMAMVGVQDVSVIATPPARRQPIRTFLIPFDAASVRNALLREHSRAGQSFMVVPRIEDIEPIRAQLTSLVPELEVLVAHGQLPVEEADAAMVRFAEGHGDVLLATNIIESGLDVPRANTMLVWRPERFGLAQLHQLRGRVGRGRLQGVAYLLADPQEPMSHATQTRLETLEAFDRLGAGLAISARDLDLRGAGDLVGEEQAGHMKLIGLGLYQHLLERAVRVAKGEPVHDEAPPELSLDVVATIPATYVAEPELRIGLYVRLSRLASISEVDAFEDEMGDRFGPPPQEVLTLLSMARLRLRAKDFGVSKISAGPKAIALTFHPDSVPGAARKAAERREDLFWREDRLVYQRQSGSELERLELTERLLDELAG